MKALVIIPTYNESENIKNIISEVLKQDEIIEVLVVDDNSPDKTAELVKKMMQSENRIKILQRRSKWDSVLPM